MSDTTPTHETPDTKVWDISSPPMGAPLGGAAPPMTAPVSPVMSPVIPPVTPPVTPPPSMPYPSEPATFVDGPTGERRWVTWTVRSLVGVSMVGLAALSAYLWVTNGEWTSQNEDLRAEALDLGETLARERAAAEVQAQELALVGTQLETANDRISDLANEEANAIDDRNALENLVENFRGCSDQRQEIINVLTDSRYGFQGKTAAQVERETTKACDEVAAIHDAYLAERGN